jgi:hypothetical protein
VGIVNRRNAVIGYFVWQAGKFYVRAKARNVAPKIEERRPNKTAIALFAAAVGGIVFFWRRRVGGDDGPGE